MSRNEAQTRYELIDPALEARGWLRADIRIEETPAPVDIVYGKGQRRLKGRTDYVLRRPLESGAEPLPLAIIEAKREGLPPEHGLQQAKGYRVGRLHHVPFVFASNGHLFVEYNEASASTSDPKPLSAFPRPEELVARYLKTLGMTLANPEMRLLLTPYKQGRDYLRYYQDASVRAAIEQIIAQCSRKKAPRVLLALGTGSGKTRIAAALLRRMFDAGILGKALFLCDRTELRDNGLGDFQAAFGTDAAEVRTHRPEKNARVLIATYQTVDQDQDGKAATFFTRHYPPGFFDAIVIDECHRSAWGKWFAILQAHPDAIQIGLTATPRRIRLPKCKDEATRRQIEADRRLVADNLRYFGKPAYEYSYQQGVADGYLAPADLETYDIFHDGHGQPERVRGVRREDLKYKRLTNALTGRRVPLNDAPRETQPPSLELRLVLPDRVEAMSRHFFERLLATGDGDPHQKTIIFCASDHHADLVANRLNELYAAWCKKHRRKRAQTYAFKCMASSDGQSLIPDFRGRARSHFIATTKELLTTGVDVPNVRNIVFFRYIQSPLLFHQMIGRGTRLPSDSDKLIFRIFDYTGATALFGKDFISPLPPQPDSDGAGSTGDSPAPIKATGIKLDIQDSGRFKVVTKDGRLTRVTPQEYQRRLIDELTATVPTVAEFRSRWLDPERRRELLDQLGQLNLLPAALREATHMEDYDEFDVLAAVAYGIRPLTRAQRAALFGDSGPAWLIRLPQPTAKVIRKIVKQFERAGTGALETPQLWKTIDEPRAIDSLAKGGKPADLLRMTKETLFAA